MCFIKYKRKSSHQGCKPSKYFYSIYVYIICMYVFIYLNIHLKSFICCNEYLIYFGSIQVQGLISILNQHITWSKIFNLKTTSYSSKTMIEAHCKILRAIHPTYDYFSFAHAIHPKEFVIVSTYLSFPIGIFLRRNCK